MLCWWGLLFLQSRNQTTPSVIHNSSPNTHNRARPCVHLVSCSFLSHTHTRVCIAQEQANQPEKIAPLPSLRSSPHPRRRAKANKQAKRTKKPVAVFEVIRRPH